MKETPLMKKIQLHIGGKFGTKLFRNNVGTAFNGRILKRNGKMVIDDARRITFGLCVGSADLIGWHTRIIDGKPVAVFVAIEVKTKTGKASDEQLNFIQQVIKGGGIAGIARSTEEAERLFEL